MAIAPSPQGKPVPDSGAFLNFVTVAEQIGATTKRLEKAAILGQYLTSLSDEDLCRAARYFAGYTFPLRDQRTTNVGGSALMAALIVATGADAIFLQEQLVKLGDLGDVAAVVAPRRTPSLQLTDVAIALDRLANTRGAKQKTQQVTQLLQRAAPLEAPRIVLEVTFDRVQPSNRHKGGYALRFPRILRIRDDKPPEEIDTLETVRKLADGM